MGQLKLISSYITQNEMEISLEEELRTALYTLQSRGNSIVLLEFPELGVLTIGVGMPYGFVEYMGADGALPYRVATNELKDERETSFVEFDSGGTLTPIPIEHCLPFDQIVEITLYFLRNKYLPDFVNWRDV